MHRFTYSVSVDTKLAFFIGSLFATMYLLAALWMLDKAAGDAAGVCTNASLRMHVSLSPDMLFAGCFDVLATWRNVAFTLNLVIVIPLLFLAAFAFVRILRQFLTDVKTSL
jgi:hypothetical protein